MFPDFHRLTREWKTFYGACVIQDKLFHIGKINQQPMRVMPLFQPTFLSKTELLQKRSTTAMSSAYFNIFAFLSCSM